ncbi:MAG: hypothetical protein DWQ10_03020, partial [Calditrichaeota bacterium]
MQKALLMHKFDYEYKNYLKHISSQNHVSDLTVQAYAKDLLLFRDFLIELDIIGGVTRNHIRKYLHYLSANKLSPKTVNRKLSSLRSFFRFLQEQKKIENNPLANIQSVKEPQVVPKFLQRQQVLNAVSQLDTTDETCLRDALIVLFLYGCGLRVSELVNLTIHNLDLYAGQIKVIGKRQKERIIPLPKSLFKQSQQWLKTRRSRQLKASLSMENL